MQTAAPLLHLDSRRADRCALALIGALSLLLAFLPSPTPVRAAPTRQVTPITVTGMTINSEFGSAIAVSGDTLVVGAPRGDGLALTGGVAVVFVRTIDGWSQQAILTAPDVRYSDQFGEAVAIDGDTIAVGAPHSDGPDSALWAGAVYIFVRAGTTWTLQAKLMADVPGYHSWFGRSVALEGDTLVIGADRIGAGAAYVFERSGATWRQQARLTAGVWLQGGEFGAAVAIDGGIILVGAPYYMAAYLFTHDATGWVARQTLSMGSVPDSERRRFGWSVAIAGDRLVVGAPRMNDDAAAAAYVFSRAGAQWVLESTLTASDDTEPLSFGMAVAIDNDTIAVGAPEHHLEGFPVPNFVGFGAVYLYRRSGSTWPLSAFLSPNGRQSVTKFGDGAIIQGDHIVVGAPRTAGPQGSADGAVYESSLGLLTQAVDDRATTPEETPVTVQVLANDTVGPDGSLDPSFIDLTLLHPPQHGKASVNPIAGTITYTPAKDFNGEDRFTYNAGWGLPASVTVTVTPVPDPPSFTSQPPLAAIERVPYIYQVRAADPDPGDRLQISAPVLPGWLALTDRGDGTALLTGTATLADLGAHRVSLQVIDALGLQATQEFTVSVESFVPLPPDTVSAEILSTSQIRLSWRDRSNNEYLFRVERSTAGGPWQTVYSGLPNQTTFTDTWRTCNTPYAYRVIAIGARGPSPPSETATVTILDCTLPTPAELRAMVATTSTIVLQWVELSENATEIAVERAIGASPAWTEIGRVVAGRRIFLDHDLSCGPIYTYRVRAANPGGFSDYSNVVRATVCPPVAPEQLRVAATSKLTVTLTWNDASENETYFVLERQENGLAWVSIGTLPANTTSYTDNLGSCDTGRTYHVRAVNGAGSSAPSNILTTTTDPCAVGIVYVDVRATAGGRTGHSWADAYTEVQPALDATAVMTGFDRQEIWVAEGTYRPTAGTGRDMSFRLVDGVGLYGGFRGTETARDQRDWRSHVTILSGDIGVVGDASDNSYHVVVASGASAATILDGFTITGGNANGNGTSNQHLGGGLYNWRSSTTVRHVIFRGNSATMGGGMGSDGGEQWGAIGSQPTLEATLFMGNAASEGGGMANRNGSWPTLTNVLFSGNRASRGGGMSNTWYSDPLLINVTFSANHASEWGGAMRNSADADPYIRNSIFWGNTSPLVGQIYNESENSVPIVSDSLLQENLFVVGEVGGTRNRIADPLFVDADGADQVVGTLDDDVRLRLDSPAIDAGNNTSLPYGLMTDLDGNPRFTNHRSQADTGIGTPPIVDIGAYEYQPPPAPRAAPSALTARATSRTSIALAWTDNSNDEQGFAIERQIGGTQGWVEIARVTANITTYSDSPLPCGTAQTYRVRAYNPGGETAASPSASATTGACVQQIIYVDRDATGANDGTSWANAYTDLQLALSTTTIRGDEIWVAEGTYKPTAGADRGASFRLISGVALYGGFLGTESRRDQRDWAAHLTILSGDLLGNDPTAGPPSPATFETIMADNSYHVVSSADTDAATILDGVTIMGGNAYQAPNGESGGGLLNTHGNLTIRNVLFKGNVARNGGGIANLAGSTSTISHARLTENLCYAGMGGAMYNADSKPQLTDVVFHANDTYASYGAGMANQNSNPTLERVTFYQNDSYWGAGGMHNLGSNPTLLDVSFEENLGDIGGMYNGRSNPLLKRVTFTGNVGRYTIGGGGMYNDGSDPTLIDVIFSKNASNLGGGGMLNSGSRPMLVNVRFTGNRATGDAANAGGGGGMLNYASSPLLYNVVFSGNSVTSLTFNRGGAIANYYESRPTLVNVTLSGNSAREGGGIYSTDGSHPTVRNSIVWGNLAVGAGEQVFTTPSATISISNTIIQTGTVDSDQLFIDSDGADNIVGTADDDLHLRAGSPAIDAGDNAALPPDPADLDGDGNLSEQLPVDVDGNPRRVDDPGRADTGSGAAPLVDIGAYEYQFSSPGEGEPAVLITRANGVPVPPGSTLDLGESQIGRPVALNLVVHQAGTAPLDIGAPAEGLFGGANAADFSVPSGAPPFRIASGEGGRTMTIQCVPGAAGQRTAFLQLATNVPSLRTVTYQLVCTGTTSTGDPTLAINYATGMPGSFFTIRATNVPANAQVTFLINGYVLSNIASTSAAGTFTYLLDTSNAQLGHYDVTMRINMGTEVVEQRIGFDLRADAPLREPEADASATVVQVPRELWGRFTMYLPLVR